MKPAINHHILIVEDDTWFADSTKRTLTAHGFDVTWASSAQAAVEAVEQQLPHLILLDVFLPQANGLQLLHELRSYEDSSRVPVIICSSTARDMLPQNLESYGVLTVLDKARLTPARLVGAVKEVLLK